MPSRLKALARQHAARLALMVAAAIICYGASMEFYNIAWGTGNAYGQFSIKWGAAFLTIVVLCAALLVGLGILLWRGFDVRTLHRGTAAAIVARWIVGAVTVAFPIWLLQYSPWGVVYAGPYLRLLLWAISAVVLTIFFMTEDGIRPQFKALLAALAISGSAFVAAAAVTEVTSYPFSLGWSEGNRLWDYSLLFGRHLYTYEPGQEPSAYLDIGRQLIGGLPFLLPKVSILGERLWLAAVSAVPYLIVGLLAFWSGRRTNAVSRILAGLAGFMFLSQGPIHAPLLVCAILVLVAWRLPLGWAATLLVLAGYFAETSRFTWMFAPAMWAVMLEMGGAEVHDGRLKKGTWQRTIVLGLAGLFGSALAYAGFFSWSATSVGSSASVSTSQVLLWYRLLPNATYGEGILFGLARAAIPLVAVLIFAALRYWRPRALQVLAVGLSLGAFLAVGLVVSTKIGGGGDLHNLDMFLIGLLIVAAILWKAFSGKWLAGLEQFPFGIKAAMALALIVPAFGPLLSLRPISFAKDAEWISVLADVERPRDLGSLPSKDVTDASLMQLREAVDEAEARGPVLFMDQRQLLTFGYVDNVELIPGYEKKRVMDEALSGNLDYFDAFYRELADRRFALIVSSPLRTPIKDSEYGFGEENNAWVNWVAKPILCYYAEQDTLDAVKVELLVPRSDPLNCEASLPRTQP